MASAASGAALADSEPRELSPEQLFRRAAPSVHMIAAAGALQDIKERRDVNLGSAVAVTDRELITNCHVVQGKKLIVLLHGGRAYAAERLKGDDDADICVLRIPEPVLIPVGRIRPYASLATGERIFTIGSPLGLENTLNDGLIAGLRTRNSQRLVQITAQIAHGSSGGGLFDRYGNLVGITSYILNEIQTIGFAIAIDEFARVATLPPAAEVAGADAGRADLAAARSPALTEAPATTPATAPARTDAPRAYRLELGVARNRAEAQQTWRYVTGRYGDLLAGLKPETQLFGDAGKEQFVRLLAGTIADRSRADQLCAELTRRGHASCAVR